MERGERRGRTAVELRVQTLRVCVGGHRVGISLLRKGGRGMTASSRRRGCRTNVPAREGVGFNS